MSQVNGFKGFVGYAIRELTQTEMNSNCLLANNVFPFIEQRKNDFTSDFLIRSYTSGCYYYDASTGKWSSHGMEIHEGTDLESTHCSSFHLTAFAGGLVILPSEINFAYVFANASISRNPIIYVTVIVVMCTYVLLAVWSRRMDRKDLAKLNILLVENSVRENSYLYELIVFTGNRKESGTHSKVKPILFFEHFCSNFILSKKSLKQKKGSNQVKWRYE